MNYLPSDYYLLLWSYLMCYWLLAASLNLVMGSAGYLSLAHGAFMACGGYSYALIMCNSNLGVEVVLPVTALLGAGLGMALALPALRLRGDVFVLAGLALQTFFHASISNSYHPGGFFNLGNIANGTLGISDIPKPVIFGTVLNSQASRAVLSTVVAIFCSSALFWLRISPWGRSLRALRDDEEVSRSLGKRIPLIKLEVFAVSGSIAAIAGALYATQVGFVSPQLASIETSTLILMMTCIGGLGTLRGSFVGAALILSFPEIFRLIGLRVHMVDNWRLLLFGIVLVVLMHVRPRGLLGSEEIS